MPARPRRLRPYRASGLYAAPAPPATGLREQLIADHLGGEPSAAQSILLGLLSSAVAKHASVSNYLRSLPHPWVNKRRNAAWQIVHDLSKLERHVARLVAARVDPALERRPRPVEDLATYIARRDAETAAQDAPPSPTPPNRPGTPGEHARPGLSDARTAPQPRCPSPFGHARCVPGLCGPPMRSSFILCKRSWGLA
jgi:hypothetical protein